MVLMVREERSKVMRSDRKRGRPVTTQLHGGPDRCGAVGIDEQRPGVVGGARFGGRCLAVVGFGIAIGLVMAAAIAAPTVSAASASRSGTAKCSTSNVHGVQTISYCGPATATLRIGGKTYSFQNGECVSISVSGITVDVTLGAIADKPKSGTSVKGNAGKPYFSLDLSPGEFSDVLHNVEFGGKQLTAGGSVTAKGTIVSKGTSSGTFSSQGAYDNSNEKWSVSVTWNCHGAVAKH
jgi:hypothetical protein